MAENKTLQETVEHKDVLISQGYSGTFLKIIETSELPIDKYFRPAWRWNGTAITLDLPICQQRHLEKLRRVRNTKLQNSDAEYIKALEQNNTSKLDTLKQYRQALRDLPETIQTEMSNAATPNDIKAIRPAILDQQI